MRYTAKVYGANFEKNVVLILIFVNAVKIDIDDNNNKILLYVANL